ncbi:MAG: glycosyltransferase family 2 protein [Acidimicrobiia bacterium]|nr:glycosyltransferase family 2 protein [Acidimicrobiia bacterium]
MKNIGSVPSLQPSVHPPDKVIKPPTLSVIIPNYNHAAFLPRSLGAILAQSVQPLEIIVMDDASTDNSVEVIESFVRRHPHIRLHRNARNLGVVANGNRAVDLAQGDYMYPKRGQSRLL